MDLQVRDRWSALHPAATAQQTPAHDVPEGKPRMPEVRASLMEPRMEHLLDRVGSKFTLVTLAAMRAREINDYYNQLGEGLGKIVPPQVTSVSRKPLTISMEEIEAGKIEAAPLPEEPEVPEVEAADTDETPAE